MLVMLSLFFLMSQEPINKCYGAGILTSSVESTSVLMSIGVD